MDLESIFEDDKGVWIDHIPGLGDIRLRVRPIVSWQVMRAHARLTESGDMDADEIDHVVYRDHVLTDWDGIEHDGEPYPHRPDNAEKLMASGIFMKGVRWAAQKALEHQEALEKNLPVPSLLTSTAKKK